MSDDNNLRDRIVQYFIVGLLAAVVIFLVFGLARGNGDDNSEPAATPAANPTPASKPAVMKAQVGCQQPSAGQPATGKKTLPPNPGVSARKSSSNRVAVTVTIPTSTQECRVARIRVLIDSKTTKSVSVLTGPPVRKINVKVAAGASPPQLARGYAITSDGRSSSGATVAVQ